MAGFVGGAAGGGGFDYVQAGTPDSPQLGETWFDTDAGSDGNGEVKVYNGTDWQVTGYISHADLLDVSPAQHHNPVSVSGPLTEDGEQGLGLSVGDGLDVSGGTLLAALTDPLTVDVNGNVAVSLGNGLTLDGDGQVSIPASAVGTSELADGSVTQAELAFATATQSELDSLASATSSDLSALDTAINDHATRTDNPHQVSDDQTGAASALSSHATDTANPHDVTDDQTGAASALSSHESDGDAHHTRYSDSEAQAAAPVQSVNGQTGSVDGLASDSELSDHASTAAAHPAGAYQEVSQEDQTWYQNTSGGPQRLRVVFDADEFRGETQAVLYVASTQTERLVDASYCPDGWQTSVSAVVPDGHYYKFDDTESGASETVYIAEA
ncbi:hypothetical protein [Halosegnis longus]|uniref:hypothetical protein n=1 Tax=Halosegnis longus TaxID=2216012 RepID=UPI00129E6EFB|nr:hypothetical protein [Halosegnis longus]